MVPQIFFYTYLKKDTFLAFIKHIQKYMYCGWPLDNYSLIWLGTYRWVGGMDVEIIRLLRLQLSFFSFFKRMCTANHKTDNFEQKHCTSIVTMNQMHSTTVIFNIHDIEIFLKSKVKLFLV